ncbi:hypothetical protein L1987_15945 [Smallanthus sonchifolius]|uniref:Uncharacterized protein n=1 Tax=Smallanthus sonchifolius TaxID=185202 RepID=A0ACB9JAG2_9ASTR|nr:hypothetical protein L1987_15945 [Smallanthus sonchifolius]
MVSENRYKLTHTRTEKHQQSEISKGTSSSKRDKEISIPPRKKLKLKIKKDDGKRTPQTSGPKKADCVNDEDNEVSLPPRKKLKLKIKKAKEKRTPQTSSSKKADFVNAEEKDAENDDDDDFVRPPPPRVISKTPQAKKISNSRDNKN